MDLLRWRRGPRGDQDAAAEGELPSQINHYRVRRVLGQGGMGVVYLAEDERLGRDVALKVLRDSSSDPSARLRLVREARIAAGVSHPLICQVFELGEWNNQPFIAMELIDGEPLAGRLSGGALPASEALQIAVAVVDALGVLHRRGVIHRDLKPSNVFVTATGIKVVDFGLARPVASAHADTAITNSGIFLGTPRYAAPEQLLGDEVDERADLFSAAVMLFEMLAGRLPFSGKTLAAIAQSVLHDTPPVLTGSPAISAADRILHRALSKKLEERYQTAEALAADLRAALQLAAGDQVAEARTMLRLAVLPFRLLKRDPETDYLGLSLADALVSSLTGLESLVVRSTLKSARYANTVPDLEVLAADLAVDVVLTGSILRAQDQVRVSAELVSVPAGDSWWSQTTHVPLDAVIDLHDELARRVIASLPLTAQDRNYRPRAAGNAKAFDLYLHGMRLRAETASWRQAHVFFEQCLELDPTFAPAWAERGRLERLFGKYEDPAQLARAESGVPSRARARSRQRRRAVLLRAARNRPRAPRCGARAPARAGASSARRAAHLRGPGSCLPLWRAARRVAGRTSPRTAARPDAADHRASHLLHAGRLRAGAGRGGPRRRSVRGRGPLGAGPGGRSPGQRAPGGRALRVRAVDARVLVGVCVPRSRASVRRAWRQSNGSGRLASPTAKGCSI